MDTTYYHLRDCSGGNVLAAGASADVARAYLEDDNATVRLTRAGGRWMPILRTISGHSSRLSVDLPVTEYRTEETALTALYAWAFEHACADVRYVVVSASEILDEIAEAETAADISYVVGQICEPLPRLAGTTPGELARSAAEIDPDAARLLEAAEDRRLSLLSLQIPATYADAADLAEAGE